jgi:hypothetical protein
VGALTGVVPKYRELARIARGAIGCRRSDQHRITRSSGTTGLEIDTKLEELMRGVGRAAR